MGRSLKVRKCKQSSSYLARTGQQRKTNSSDHREGTLGSHQQAREIVASDPLGLPPTSLYDCAVGTHRGDAQYKIARHPILEGNGPARIGRDIAAQRAGIQGVGIGRIKEAVLISHLLSERSSYNTGLNLCVAMLTVYA
jgi:hypothetical protein